MLSTVSNAAVSDLPRGACGANADPIADAHLGSLLDHARQLRSTVEERLARPRLQQAPNGLLLDLLQCQDHAALLLRQLCLPPKEHHSLDARANALLQAASRQGRQHPPDVAGLCESLQQMAALLDDLMASACAQRLRRS